MVKKILPGMLFVAICCAIAATGYKFGKYLAHKDNAVQVRQVSRP